MKLFTDPQEHQKHLEESIVTESSERTPGVYVRTHQPPPGNELDLLWAGAKGHPFREDRSPFLYFTSGFLLGVFLTAAVSFFFFIKPSVKTGDTVLTKPVINMNAPSTPSKPETKLPSPTTPKINTPTQATPVSSPASQTPPMTVSHHKVRDGETLERIARHYYGSGSPAMIEKLVRANNLKNPNALQLDQDLVIPPKSY